jgi:hypothetical protein
VRTQAHVEPEDRDLDTDKCGGHAGGQEPENDAEQQREPGGQKRGLEPPVVRARTAAEELDRVDVQAETEEQQQREQQIALAPG